MRHTSSVRARRQPSSSTVLDATIAPSYLSFALLAFALAFGACSTTEQEVQEQIEILAANDIRSETWNQATDELVQIGRPAARQLVALLDPALYKGKAYREFRDEMEKTRVGAAVVLGRIKHKAAAASLHARITNVYTFDERVAALEAVGELGFNADVVKALKKQFGIETDPIITLHLAIALIKMDDAVGAPALVAAVTGDDEKIASTAIDGLQAANYFGVELLVDLTARGVREKALRAAIARTREELVVQLESEDPDVRMHSARGLGAIGDPSVNPALTGLLSDKSNLVRFDAASSLTTLGDATGMEFLFSSMDSDDPIRRLNAVRSLVDVQTHSGTVEKRLIEGLSAADPRTRSGCAQILGEAAVTAAVPDLIRVTGDAVAEVRWSAVIALGRMGAAASRDRLQKLLEDEDSTVKYYAAWALDQLGAG